MDKAVDRVTTSCHHCASLHTVPTTVVKQSTNPPPDTVGISFAADVIKRAKQFILVLRECVTSYTVSTLLPNKRHDTLCDALISLCINMQPLGQSPCCYTNWNRPSFHGSRQRPSPSQPQNCSWDRQSQELKQEPCCGKSGPRTWTWTPSTGSPWWASLSCCTLCRNCNPELTNLLSGIVSSRNVDTARSVLKYPDSTTVGDYDLISPSSEPP